VCLLVQRGGVLQLYSPHSRISTPALFEVVSVSALSPLFFPVFINFSIPPPRACSVPQTRTQGHDVPPRVPSARVDAVLGNTAQHSRTWVRDLVRPLRNRATHRHLRKEDKMNGSCITHKGGETCMHISVEKHEGCCRLWPTSL
jgi:hypothetical protein